MSLRILGAIMIVGATSVYGYMLVSDIKKRLNELLEMKRIMFLLKSETGYNAAPIKEALYNISKRTSTKYTMIFKKIYDSNEVNIGEVWKREWKSGLEKFHLSQEEKEEIINLSDSMGLQDVKSQNAQFDLYLLKLEESIKELTEEIPKKNKVYKCVGIGGGVILAIIFL